MPRARVKTTSIASLKNPCLPGARSAAERAREKKLRDDPMAIVVSPLYVDCKRCGARIKLSSKSSYDTFHWRTHRTRCLKKTGTRGGRKTKITSSSPVKGGGGIAAAEPPDEPQKSHEVPPTPKLLEICPNGSYNPEIVDDNSYSASLDLLTSVASAALRKPDVAFDNYPPHPVEEFPKSCASSQWRRAQPRNIECRCSDTCRYELRDEMRMRQEAVESLALLSRSG
ncbi:hypothetical protein AX15_003110 [Amanita polypyramis BW_CC]|nr:hypothetical protein AX15_003110 [Amanita polypyramis BW_CC]